MLYAVLLALTSVHLSHSIIYESDLSQSAFCQPWQSTAEVSGHAIFPLRHNTIDSHCGRPWIWDAIYDPVERSFEILLQSRKSCDFNTSLWRQYLERYPQYSNQLGDGDLKNKLTPSCHRSLDLARLLNRKRVILSIPLYKTINNNNNSVYNSNNLHNNNNKNSIHFVSIRSLPISISSAFRHHISLRIQVTLSDLHHAQLVRDHTLHLHYPKEILALFPKPEWQQLTVKIPYYCYLPLYTHHTTIKEVNMQQQLLQETEETHLLLTKQKKRYHTSICTALPLSSSSDNNSSSSISKELLFWLLYHRRLGIQHIYLYDTTSSPSSSTLHHTLQALINTQFLTIIPWPYSDCMYHLGSGRPIAEGSYIIQEDTTNSSQQPQSQYNSQGQPLLPAFLPPANVQQVTALNSCLMRFKHTSQFILSIDPDEYIHLVEDKTKKNQESKKEEKDSSNSNSNSINNQQYDQSLSLSLPAVIDEMFNKILRLQQEQQAQQPRHRNDLNKTLLNTVIAMGIRPVWLLPCPHLFVNSKSNNDDDVKLLDTTWHFHRLGAKHENKLLLNTKFVRSFLVHYVGEVNPVYVKQLPWRQAKVLTLNITKIVLLHMKDTKIMSKILGNPLPLPANESELIAYQEYVCSKAFPLPTSATMQVNEEGEEGQSYVNMTAVYETGNLPLLQFTATLLENVKQEMRSFV